MHAFRLWSIKKLLRPQYNAMPIALMTAFFAFPHPTATADNNGLAQRALNAHILCNAAQRKAQLTTQKLRQIQLRKKARRHCQRAAQHYSALLKTKTRRYTYTWHLANALFGSQKYARAEALYQQVRDWPKRRTHQHSAARGLFETLSQRVRLACQRKQLTRACPREQRRHRGQTHAGTIPLPPLHKRLRSAMLDLVKRTKSNKERTQLYHAIAQLYYAYQHRTQAKEWYWRFLKASPKHPYAKSAAQAILASHYHDGQLAHFVKSEARLKTLGIRIYRFPYGLGSVVYARARLAHKRRKWTLAANAYMEAANRSPRMRQAPYALWHAAHIFQKQKRYNSALHVFSRISRQYPSWKLARAARLRERALRTRATRKRPTKTPTRKRP